MNLFSYFSVLLSLCVLTSCTPYTAELKNLDQAYKSGAISAENYYVTRSNLLQAQQQWSATTSAAVQQASANINQTIQQQQELDAYNARTRALAQPQRVNVYHSGTINHNVNVYPYNYGY